MLVVIRKSGIDLTDYSMLQLWAQDMWHTASIKKVKWK